MVTQMRCTQSGIGKKLLELGDVTVLFITLTQLQVVQKLLQGAPGIILRKTEIS